MTDDPRIAALPDIHGHAKGEHKPYAEERPIPYTARMLFLWFFHACRRGSPRFLMVADHINYLTFEDPAAVNLVRRALKLAQAGDLYGAAETAGVELHHAAAVSEGLRRGMRYSIGAEVDNDPRSRPDAQNIVDAMRPDGMVRSVHFLPITHPQHGENWMWPFDNAEFKEFYDMVGIEATWELYVATLLEAIDKLPGNIVGHFYVPAKFGHWPADDALERYEDRLLEACAERGMAIEVNSRYFYKYFADDAAQREKYRTVTLRLLRKAKERGVMVAVGSDAHSPRDQGGAFDVVLALLDEAEINEIAFPINGRLARVALKATEEILRQAGGYVEPAPVAPPVTATGAEHEPAEPAVPAKPESPTIPVAAAAAPGSAPPNGARRTRPSRAKAKPAAAEPVPPSARPAPQELPPILRVPEAAPQPAAARVRSGVAKAAEDHPAKPSAPRAVAPNRPIGGAPARVAAGAGRVKKTTAKAMPARTEGGPKAARPVAKAPATTKKMKDAAPGRHTPKRSAKKAATPKRSAARPTAKKSAVKKTSPTRKAASKRAAPLRRPASKKPAKPSKKSAAKKSVAKRKKSRR